MAIGNKVENLFGLWRSVCCFEYIRIFWIWKVMRKKLFQPIDIKEVMAMENDLYLIAHRQDGENKVCCSTDRNMRRR